MAEAAVGVRRHDGGPVQQRHRRGAPTAIATVMPSTDATGDGEPLATTTEVPTTRDPSVPLPVRSRSMMDLFTEVGWTKPDPATTTERKSTPVATNRHSSGTEQHLDMDEEGRRRSERDRTRQTAACGPSPTSSHRYYWSREHEPWR
ncbi:hypothetical protein HPB47_012037 [Ixodes persulcatus]|uniref:Uncharacterized protein n=1 Tax=Ixodes persulcatus TaxID=34615 RepID=A0AC60NUM1_IXOPE|nr:hypothetical protein HPB47_012037 [Ixodes persulcatus]